MRFQGNSYILPLSNGTKAGKPKNQIIKGQDFYNGTLDEHVRGTIMAKIKDNFRPYIKAINPILTFPIKIRAELHETIRNPFDVANSGDGNIWDVDNHCYPYLKAFPDLLRDLKKVPDDDRLHITQPPAAVFCPVERHEDRKFVFIIEHDDRPEVQFKAIKKAKALEVGNKVHEEFEQKILDPDYLDAFTIESNHEIDPDYIPNNTTDESGESNDIKLINND